MTRTPPWQDDLPDDLTPEQGLQIARDRIAWYAQGYPQPAAFEGWRGDTSMPEDFAPLDTDTLNLAALGLHELPAELYDVEGLNFLFLQSNQLETLPSAFAKRMSLTSLALFHNPLREVPAELFSLSRLEDLYLANTALTSLPVLADAGSTLRMLTLDQVPGLEIPSGFLASLPNLRSLSIAESGHRQLPDGVFELVELRQLAFEDNPLEALPDAIGALSNLTQLNLERCKLTTLPKALAGLTHLGEAAKADFMGLRIAGNPFKDKELKRIAKLKNPQRTIQALAWSGAHGTD